jgi:hypothetical protein
MWFVAVHYLFWTPWMTSLFYVLICLALTFGLQSLIVRFKHEIVELVSEGCKAINVPFSPAMRTRIISMENNALMRRVIVWTVIGSLVMSVVTRFCYIADYFPFMLFPGILYVSQLECFLLVTHSSSLIMSMFQRSNAA